MDFSLLYTFPPRFGMCAGRQAGRQHVRRCVGRQVCITAAATNEWITKRGRAVLPALRRGARGSSKWRRMRCPRYRAGVRRTRSSPPLGQTCLHARPPAPTPHVPACGAARTSPPSHASQAATGAETQKTGPAHPARCRRLCPRTQRQRGWTVAGRPARGQVGWRPVEPRSAPAHTAGLRASPPCPPRSSERRETGPRRPARHCHAPTGARRW
mmetsp:Transcript_24658/g.61849  ORF Transcript_24658/g.61849 Transcript_24658/m.61849 type:complete len:213 (+) Transcript_24658:161-799(+)